MDVSREQVAAPKQSMDNGTRDLALPAATTATASSLQTVVPLKAEDEAGGNKSVLEPVEETSVSHAKTAAQLAASNAAGSSSTGSS